MLSATITRNAKPILRRTREILAKRGVWIQGDWGRTKEGNDVPPCTPEAVQFCLDGAICRATCELTDTTVKRSYQSPASAAAARRLRASFDRGVDGRPSVIEFNDTPGRSRADILAALDKAVS